MDWLAWIFLYAVALVVFQVLVYRYLWTREEPFERTAPHARPNSDGEAIDDGRRHERLRTDAAAGLWVNTGPMSTSDRQCPHCGEENEPDRAFTFCWNCTGRLA
ncbi:hypothetical protein SAMN04487950_0185 [Halogranum rubrum]|uniref:DUF7577 domain-containing protein n=1 Tax=Halogranum rubrum TaxID=553466 RepID=A0A1I4AZ55_9EURY|nr:hypothetical protein [Halogranum rubrum]SFK61440.1 hypothetical protein SAMN04487950_0185 [Halogranum rubrum]